jgi:hypothetical protein
MRKNTIMMSNPMRDDILDRCVEARRAGADPEAILRDHPELADEIRPLLGVASRLEELPSPQPDRAQMRATVARAVTESHPEAGRRRGTPRRTWWGRIPAPARAAVLLFAVLSAGWGTITVSQPAVPGELLYPLKRFAERAQCALALHPEHRAHLHVTLSDARLREAMRMRRLGRRIEPQLLHEMLAHNAQALNVSAGLDSLDRKTLLRRVASAHQYQAETLAELAEDATGEERELLLDCVSQCTQRCRCLKELDEGCRSGIPCPSCESSGELLRDWLKRRYAPAAPQGS